MIDKLIVLYLQKQKHMLLKFLVASSDVILVHCERFLFYISASLLEFIVSFDSYYDKDKRYGFIADALKQFHSNSWKEVERFNPASTYPSDFTLLQVCNP